jgi:hypothetical protein
MRIVKKLSKISPFTPKIVMGTVITFILVGSLITAFEGNGLRTYSGAKKDAATLALHEDLSAYSPAVSVPWQHIDDISLAKPGFGVHFVGGRCPTDASKASSYAVTISRVWLFGWRFTTKQYDACGLAG